MRVEESFPTQPPRHRVLAAEPVLRTEIEEEILNFQLAATGPVLYSIRMPKNPGLAQCPFCAARFLAAGPTGYADDQPICDACLMRGAEELGMVLTVIAIVRAYAVDLEPTSPSFWANLAELGAFVRVYQRYAIRSGPARPILDGGSPFGQAPGTAQ